MKLLANARARFRVRRLALGSVVKHLDVARESAVEQKGLRLLADRPDLVASAEKVEREKFIKLLAVLVPVLGEILPQVFRVKRANERYVVFVREAHGLHARRTGAMRVHNVKRTRVDAREIMQVQRGHAGFRLRSAGQGKREIVQHFKRVRAAVPLGHDRGYDIHLVSARGEPAGIGVCHAADAVVDGQKRIGALRNLQHGFQSSALILAQRARVRHPRLYRQARTLRILLRQV